MVTPAGEEPRRSPDGGATWLFPGQPFHMSVAFLHARLYACKSVQAFGFLPERDRRFDFPGFGAEQCKTPEGIGEIEMRSIR